MNNTSVGFYSGGIAVGQFKIVLSLSLEAF